MKNKNAQELAKLRAKKMGKKKLSAHGKKMRTAQLAQKNLVLPT